MVKLQVKRNNEDQILYETSVESSVDEVTEDITNIYNGRLKISRLCSEIEELSKYGTYLPHNMIGLTDEQIQELKLVDEFGEKCSLSGWSFNKDPIGRRNGRQPSEAMQEVLRKAMEECKIMVSKKHVSNNVCVTLKMVQSALDILRGAVMIAYPMGLPPNDPIRLELENNEDLAGTHASLEVIELPRAQLWFSGKELQRGKKLKDHLGRNEKTKIIVKLQKAGQGAPAREPVISEEEQKAMMMHAYRRQEELKKLDEDMDNEYLNSSWADSNGLKRSLQGISGISWRPK